MPGVADTVNLDHIKRLLWQSPQHQPDRHQLGNQSTPKSVQKLQTALHAKAKAEAGYRFYALYDKISREDTMLFAMYYNFVSVHKTLRTTPAMAAKLTEWLWEIGDIVDGLEAWEASNAH